MRFPRVAARRSNIIFTEDEQTWMRSKWDTIRDLHSRADKASKDWRKLNDEVKHYLDRSGITDPVQRANVIGQNMQLGDLITNGNWLRNHAHAHSADLNLFLRLKELGVL